MNISMQRSAARCRCGDYQQMFEVCGQTFGWRLFVFYNAGLVWNFIPLFLKKQNGRQLCSLLLKSIPLPPLSCEDPTRDDRDSKVSPDKT